MKKVLIVNKSFETGGIQSSMINMANELAKHCQVDLFLYAPHGPMKERLSPAIRILPATWRFQALGTPMKQILATKDLRMILFRLFAFMWSKLFTNKFPIQRAIKHQPRLDGYDIAISFHQEQRKNSVLSGFSRVVAQLTDAKTKYAWVHYDSSLVSLDNNYNAQFYRKMDKVFCVSRSLRDGFIRTNPTLTEKVDFCYNFMDYEQIFEKSELPQGVPLAKDKFICFSACRLSPVKALDRAIKAMAPVFHAHPDVMWYIAGDGPERTVVEKAIKEADLETRIILLGNQKNPYPYMKNADLVLNVSYHEAAPMAFFEAKFLGVPIFATETSSTAELLHNGVDSFVCPNTAEGIHTLFSELMSNRQQIAQAKENLQAFSASNADSLEKVLSRV